MTETQLASIITAVIKEESNTSYKVENTLFLIIKNEIKTDKGFDSSKIRLDFSFPVNELDILDKRTGLPISHIPYNDKKQELFLAFDSIEQVVENIIDLRAIITLQRALRYNNLIRDNVNLRLLNKALNKKLHELVKEDLTVDSTKETNDTSPITNSLTPSHLIEQVVDILELDYSLEVKIELLDNMGLTINKLY